MKVEYLKSPITALSTIGQYLLSGVGSYVKIFNIEKDFQLVATKKVFMYNVVHGIHIEEDSDSLGLIFGGREISHFTYDSSLGETILAPSIATKDWILDAKFIYKDIGEKEVDAVAIITSHNVIDFFKWPSYQHFKSVDCEEKCILYSAHFVPKKCTMTSLKVCCGTVFNQIIVWQCTDGSSTMPVMERIKAHDGVIFDMSYDCTTKLLLSASDDRSIRIWRCKSLLNGEDTISKTECLAVLYGHGSRVWKAKVIHYDGQTFINSIGEDGNCSLWKLHIIDDSTVKTSLLKKVFLHRGRNIWSVVVHLHKSSNYIITGGSDGGIKVMELNRMLNSKPETEISSQCNAPLADSHKFIFIAQGKENKHIISVTNKGNILLYSIMENSWKILHQTDGQDTCTASSYDKTKNCIGIATQKGKISVLEFDYNFTILNSHSFSIHDASPKIHSITMKTFQDRQYIFVSDFRGTLGLYHLDFASENIATLINEFELPPAKHRWHMDATIVSNNGSNFIICGDRRGSLILYQMDISTQCDILHGIHEKQGVLSIRRHNDGVISTGRDGMWRIIEIESGKLIVMKQSRASPGMDWLSMSYYCHNNIIIAGFHGNEFVLWNERTKNTLLSITCGGGHRDWDFTTSNNSSIFVFIKGSNICINRISYDATEDKSVVMESSHGRQITSSVALGNIGGKFLFATGSEDTKVDINLFHNGKTSCLHILDDHVSSIRSMCSSKSTSSDDIYLFTAGGRTSLNCYLISKSDSQSKPITARMIASYGTQRLMSKFKGSVESEDTRHMGVCSWCMSKDKHFVASACSDGVVRLFKLNLNDKEIQFVASSSEDRHCYLKIKYIKIGRKYHLISSSTNGFVTIWDVTNVLACITDDNVTPQRIFPASIAQIQCHQSGINGLDIFLIEEKDTFVMATTGDDNALLVQLCTVKDTGIIVLCKKCVPCAHSTQVTGVKICTMSQTNEFLNCFILYTASIDQQITKWRLDISKDAESIRITFEESLFTNVADISSFDVLCNKSENGDLLLVAYGQGVVVVKDCKTF